ncbi:MAG: hypothetical protein GY811_04600 [Myxococcales bacterium]|nr:hypothetical protein [Myxococcales bacterium]
MAATNTRLCLVGGLLLLGCGKSDGRTEVSAGDGPSTVTKETPVLATTSQRDAGVLTDGSEQISCERQAFASKIAIAEASGATWMSDGSLLVIGDSGTNGAYLKLSAEDGSVLKGGSLPLDRGASDDLEGLSRIGSTLYAITSSGYMREWQAKGDGFALTRKSYSIAPKSDTESICASARDSNCGPNYEGLCLIPSAPRDSPCVGYVAAKATGKLVCLVQNDDGRLAIRPEALFAVSAPKTLSGCHFDRNERLWFGNNVFAASAVGFITGHRDPYSAVITRLGPLGLGFPEAIAVGTENRVYRFSDTAGSPSLLDKYICR